MGSRPRNAKIMDDRVARLLEALRGGCTRRAACGYARLRPATFYEMLATDDTLRNLVEEAELQAEATYTSAVLAAIPTNWQAAAWWLERRKHEDYARRDKSEMTIDVKREAARLADELGMDVDEVLAEAQRIFADAR